jgi:uncharacterized protein with beta-barrel porin domain
MRSSSPRSPASSGRGLRRRLETGTVLGAGLLAGLAMTGGAARAQSVNESITAPVASPASSGYAATVSGSDSITVTTSGAGTVTGNGQIAALPGFGAGLGLSGLNGNITVTANAAVTGPRMGIYAVTGLNGTGAINITGSGLITTSTANNNTPSAIFADSFSGAVTVSGSGNLTGIGMGIFARIRSSSATADISVNRSGAISVLNQDSSVDHGISVNNAGSGAIRILGTGTIVSATGAGITTTAAGGPIQIGAGTMSYLNENTGATDTTTYTGLANAVQGVIGIQAANTGAGTIAITTAAGGTVTGTAGAGITTTAVNGATTVDVGATVSGTTVGVSSTASGAGAVTVTGAGNVTGAAGIVATSATGAVTVSGTGGTTGTAGRAIDARITDAGATADVVVSRSGAVASQSGAFTGIFAQNAGSGAVTLSGLGAVSSAGGIGINAIGAGGAVEVGTAASRLSGAVSGTQGIEATNTGAGTIAVRTGTGATVTGTAGAGITTTAVNGGTTVDVGANVSGTTTGVSATASSAGGITVTGAGDIAGAAGILATSVNGAVTVSGTGGTTGTAGTGIDARITDAGASADMSITRSGAVAGSAGGINATNAGSGAVTLSGLGAVSSSAGIGINASAVGGTLQVGTEAGRLAGAVSGTQGIVAANAGVGTVAVRTGTGATVTGTAGAGISATSANGATTVDVGANVSGTTTGVSATASSAGGITVTGAGNIAGAAGILASSVTGAVTVSGTGGTTGTAGTGIDATITGAGATADVVVSRSGAVAAGAVGINATNAGSGAVTLSGLGAVSSSTDVGIVASAQGGALQVGTVASRLAGAVSGTQGIVATNTGSGTIAVRTAAGGTVTGTAGPGISTTAVNGATTVDVVANVTASNSSSIVGIVSTASGAGAVTVTGAGDVSGWAGIRARSLTGAVTVSGTGGTTGAGGRAIEAMIEDAGATADILVTRSGATAAQSGLVAGIFAQNRGSGAITLSGLGAVSSAGGIGIDAIAAGGAVQVGTAASPLAGAVTGTLGIVASTTGNGTVAVRTAAGGTVTGTNAEGIFTRAADGATTVDVGATVSGTTVGVSSTATAGGAVTVTGAGNVTGAAGILAASATGAVTVSGTGGTTGTAGRGIDARITGAGATADILVSRSGAVASQSGAFAGIFAQNAGSGAVTLSGLGPVSSAGGIGTNAIGAGGAVEVGTAASPLAGAVSGTQGIVVATTGTGTIAVRTAAGGTVTGTAGAGIRTTAVSGATNIVVGANVSGTTDGIRTLAGSGNTTITINPGVSVTGGTNVLHLSTGSGNVVVNNASTIAGNVVGVRDGSGAITLSNTGVIRLADTHAISPSVTVVNRSGGVLTGTGNFGTVIAESGSFVRPGNRGLPAIGGVPQVGTMRTNGITFRSGSTLEVRAHASANDHNDFVLSLGPAVIEAGAKLNVLASPSDQAAWSTARTYTVLQATSRTGQFDVATDLAFLSPVATYTPTEVILRFERNAVTFDSVGRTPTQRSVGAAIQARQETPTPQARAFVQVLTNLTESQAAGALETLSGAGVTGGLNTAITQVSGFTKAVADQAQSQPLALGLTPLGLGSPGATAFAGSDMAMAYGETGTDAFASDAFRKVKATPAAPAIVPLPTWRVWGSFFGASYKTDASVATGTPGVTGHDWGGAAGFEYALFPNASVGVALGGSTSPFSVGKRGTFGDSTGVLGSVYGAATFDRAYVSGSLGYGRFQTSSTRVVSIPGAAVERQNVKYDTDSYSAFLEVGYRLPVLSYTVTPFAGFQPSVMRQHAASETSDTPGALFGLRYGERDTVSMPASLGLQVERKFSFAGWNAQVEARGAWVHEFRTERGLRATFTTLPDATFAAGGVRAIEDLARFSSTLTLSKAGGLSLFARAGADIAENHRGYSGQGGLRFDW